jgi:hypothetical protein
MYLHLLKDEIVVLTSLIKSMDALHDLGMKEAIPLEELQSIYSRIKLLKSARALLCKKRTQVRQDILHCSTYLHLIQWAKQRVLN